ncbi:MAG: hypothetical protein H8E79_00425 [Desulfobulbaceae bacterium]|uniref:Uncharacterized protein n=1 Tax=Candidatus Desulfatifera sulfidica TaxID=2841691 RepID=A0A8J6TCU6_9BACT|nr:hypothetical protein [Candidatus Desulfatifera sulfidica]
MGEFFAFINDWIVSTKVPEQLRDVDAKNLLRNGYFMVPFIGIMMYFVFRQAFSYLIITALIFGLWWFSGTDMVTGAVVNGEIQMDRMLPVFGVGTIGLGIIAYLFTKGD